MTKIFYKITDGSPCVFEDDANISDWSEFQETSPDAPAANQARIERNALLAETDLYGLSDVTMTSEMTAYRQALRDIPDQDGFPHHITWPTKPE